MPRVLKEKEIEKLWKNIVTIDINNAFDIIKKGGLKPMLMSNGYQVSLSLDVINKDLQMNHVSIKNSKGRTDPAEVDAMLLDILGEGYEFKGPMNFPNVIHAFKIIDQKSKESAEESSKGAKENPKKNRFQKN